MSLLTLSILSVARLIGIDKVNGIMSLKSRIRIACFSAWIVIIIVGLMNIMYVFTHNINIRNSLWKIWDQVDRIVKMIHI